MESIHNTVRPAPGYSRPQISPNSRGWNLACLRGSAAGYLRGTVTLRRVRTWVQRALRAGASFEEVRTTLNPFDLVLDADMNVAVRGGG